MDILLFQILSILGAIGFVVAGVLAVLQLRDYYKPLSLIITYLDCQPADNMTSLVLFHLSFVNPSSQGRTVCFLDIVSKVKGIPQIELKKEIGQNLQSITYSLPNVSRQLPFGETLQLPLDIPPNQSLSKWTAIGLSYQGIDPHFGTVIRFEAHNPVGKPYWHLPDKNGNIKRVNPQRRILAHWEQIVFPAHQESRSIDYYEESSPLG